MKKVLFAFSMIAMLAFLLYACSKKEDVSEQKSGTLKAGSGGCTTIQSGLLFYASGHYLYPQPLSTGHDIFGYAYQSNLYNGSYANAYLGADGYPPYLGDDAAYLAENPEAVNHWTWPYRNDNVLMKWNDAWLSKKDCDHDGKLDRHYGYPTYKGSGAWLTNHMSGSYITPEGKLCHWTDFYKIIAVPVDAVLNGGIYYSKKGVEIGPAIWGDFAIIQEVWNDPCAGYHGIVYLSPDHAGLGNW
jgi:hypothetical protein